jgi:hypothetical protein
MTGILYCSANYLKPDRKLRGGKVGIDFFNGEDSLLAHVKADKELCARLNISNILMRAQVGPSVSSGADERSGRRQLQLELTACSSYNYLYLQILRDWLYRARLHANETLLLRRKHRKHRRHKR